MVRSLITQGLLKKCHHIFYLCDGDIGEGGHPNCKSRITLEREGVETDKN